MAHDLRLGRPRRLGACLPIAFAVLASVGLIGCDDELIPGMCQSQADCKTGERCVIGGPDHHRCVRTDTSPNRPDGGGVVVCLEGPCDGGTPVDVDMGSDRPADLNPPSCSQDSECRDPNRPFCEGGTCVGCGSPDAGACPAEKPYCDATTGACAQCLESNQCSNPEAPICAGRQCSRCGPSGGAEACKTRDPGKPICAANGRCTECATNAECKTPGRSFCVADACVGCQMAGATACGGTTPVCNPGTGICSECVADADCKSDNLPFCVANKCVGCAAMGAGSCATRKPMLPACGPTGACVECATSADCKQDPARPICNTATNTCRGCTRDAECAMRGPGDPGICLDHRGGRCATESEIIYVEARTGCGTTGGTKTNPLCLAQDAPKLFSATRNIVAVTGLIEGFTWPLTSGTPALTVVGLAAPDGGGARVTGGTKSGIRLEGPGDVLVRNLTVLNGASPAMPGVVASGGVFLKLRNVTIRGNEGGGLLLNGAKFEVRQTTLTMNGPGVNGTTVWGGILILGAKMTPALLENVSVKTNVGVGIVCAYDVNGTGVFAQGNGGLDLIDACEIEPCDPEGPGCGAPAN